MAIDIRRACEIVAVLAIGVALLPQTSAWVFYQDDRQPSHSTMVGTLEIDLPEGRGLGTAVLVDRCGILTSFHTVFGPWYVTARRAPSRSFPGTFTLTEATLADGTQPAARAIPVVWGAYHGPDRHLRVPHHDWAYLVLDRCLGLEHGHFLLRALDRQDQGEIGGFAALGYSTGRQMVDPACSVHADRTPSGMPGWLHDCALQPGDSGGPIIRRGTVSIVALSARVVTDPTDAQCPSGSVRDRSAPLARWNDRCANAAVPLTGDIVARVQAAGIAVGVQRALLALGYDAGPLGAIDAPRALAAIRQVQRDMGWPVTGEPTDALRKILWLKIPVG